MSTLPEQFSATGKAQLEVQLDFLQSFGARAVDGAARLVALNIETSRAAVDSASEALRQLAGVRDPRELAALAQGAPKGFDSALQYGREWFNIVSDMQASLFKPAARVAAAAAAPAPVPVAQAAAPAAVSPSAEAEAEPRGVKPSKRPVGSVKPETQPGPDALEKPIARAAGEVAGASFGAVPSAAIVIETPAAAILPHVKPVEASPPPAVFQQDRLTPKRGKKR